VANDEQGLDRDFAMLVAEVRAGDAALPVTKPFALEWGSSRYDG